MRVSFIGLLTILFVALRLTEVITWSWLWVLSPIWMVLALMLLVVGILLVIAIGTYLLEDHTDARAIRQLRRRAR